MLSENTLAHLSERDGVGKAEHHGSVTFTYGDASVVMSFAGQFTDTIVATEAGGVEIHQLISKGIPVKIQLANGPVLLIDAGVIVELVTVQNGNEIDHEFGWSHWIHIRFPEGKACRATAPNARDGMLVRNRLQAIPGRPNLNISLRVRRRVQVP